MTGILQKLNDGRGVTASTATAMVARLASAGVVIIAMPIALHSLGAERFGAFLLLFGVINWMILGNFGVNSALGRLIASGDIEANRISEMLGSAVAYAAVTAGATALVVSGAFLLWMKMAGPRVRLPEHELLVAGFTMVALSFMQLVLQTFEGVQIGNLEIYVTNLMRITGSVFTFICLLVLPRFWPSITVFVIALSGGTLVGSAANAALVLRKTGITFIHLHRNLNRLRPLAVSGLAFLLLGAAGLLQTQMPVVILATMRGPEAAVDYGLFVRLLFVMMSVLSMVTVPLWPAIMDARSSGSNEWVRRSTWLSGWLVIGVGALCMIVLAPFGGKVISLWTGRRLTEPLIFQVAFAVYFLQIAWSHYWCIILVGFGRERFAALVHIGEGLLIAMTGAALTSRSGATGTILGAVCALACVSNWILPVVAVRALRALRASHAQLPGANQVAVHDHYAEGVFNKALSEEIPSSI